MIHYSTINQLHKANNYPKPAHPMMSLINCDKRTSCTIAASEFTSEFYMISFKKMVSGVFKYGRTDYDHDNGTLSFASPRQVIEVRDVEMEEDGFAMYFHEDFLTGHPLHNKIKSYSFFEYDSNEALHLSPREEETIWELYRQIAQEYNNNPDEFSREIMLANIDTMLKYSERFYKRQFVNRYETNGKTSTKFNDILVSQFSGNQLQEKGLPKVKDLAANLNMSTRYLSDLLKQETGKTAIELIHIFLISEAKNLLRSTDSNVNEIAYKLGFENSPYFSRLFKREVGVSPVQYKKQHLN